MGEVPVEAPHVVGRRWVTKSQHGDPMSLKGFSDFDPKDQNIGSLFRIVENDWFPIEPNSFDYDGPKDTQN